jgi:hypothetical protein
MRVAASVVAAVYTVRAPDMHVRSALQLAPLQLSIQSMLQLSIQSVLQLASVVAAVYARCS